ncbi:AMP-binding protein [Aliihoeflea aestuarii]|jgi:phenylacetate-CoA ligase|uniref:phenylacetate--CoA ligase family protein n=1 Tax=Aliihoeflea aestuarii TaxID=453840 RepID=UPI00209350D8|nr:AMP-binding protein [Aliihoeflea aestuarii]MCO6391188.1 AMP-binding protein [Aliihoeflea aestuarii]
MTDEANLLGALREHVARAIAGQPYWAERLAGIDIDALTMRDALAALPVLRKSELAALQSAAPPFGGLNATPPGQLLRLFVSPGPIFDPEGRGRDWWGAAKPLEVAGVSAGDIVLNTFSYHLTPAGAMFESGAHALGCAVIPAGPGNTADQLVAIRQFRPSVYVGTPDFLKILLDKAAADGVDASSITRAVVSGAALPPTLRAEIEGRGVKVMQAYGTADLGIVAYEDGADGMAVNDGIVLEIVRPGTGEPLPEGEVGEIVVTRLNRDYPLFRFATGDMSRAEPAGADGRPRIAGWMGRADQATKVKGMFVRPEQIAALGKALGATGRMRLVVTRADEQDAMCLKIEHADEALAGSAESKLAELTKLKGRVEIVAPGSLPNDGKVISDER